MGDAPMEEEFQRRLQAVVDAELMAADGDEMFPQIVEGLAEDFHRWHREQVEKARKEGMAVPCSVTEADGPYLEISQRVSLQMLRHSTIGPEALLDVSLKVIKVAALAALEGAPDA